MLDQRFIAKNFRRLVRPIDFSNARHALPSDKAELEKLLESVERKFTAGSVDVGALKRVSVGGKSAFAATNLETDLILRKLDDNIRRLYAITQPDRNEIVGQLIEILHDGTPIQVIRRDIKSFYESVPYVRILEKLQTDYLLSWESKQLINQLFDSAILAKNQGLPRGLAISATLAELYLRTLDRSVKNEEGVLFYARYVDDIIVISFKREAEICAAIKAEVNKLGLELNVSKSPPPLQLPRRANKLCSCLVSCQCEKYVEFLGYSFSFPGSPVDWDKRRRGRYVAVSVSRAKIRRIKERVARAFSDYCSSPDYSLLCKRIAYLTSNYPLPLNRFKKKLKGGIYYHYPLLQDESVLFDLDRFLRSLIFSQNGSLGHRLKGNLSVTQRAALKRYSFVQGFKKRFYVKLTPQDLSAIKRCWRHA